MLYSMKNRFMNFVDNIDDSGEYISATYDAITCEKYFIKRT